MNHWGLFPMFSTQQDEDLLLLESMDYQACFLEMCPLPERFECTTGDPE